MQLEADVSNQNEYMFVKTEYRMERINFSDILYIEGKGAYLRIITPMTKIMTLQSFQNMESLLPLDNFIRIHKSFIVAKNKIESIERNRIKIGSELLPIGQSYRERLLKALNINPVGK